MDDTFRMDVFSIGGVEFGISFVAKEKYMNDLKSVAGQYGLKLTFVNKTDSGEDVNVLSRKDDPKDINVNDFLSFVRKQDCWIPETDKFNGLKMLVIFHKEALIGGTNESARSNQEASN